MFDDSKRRIVRSMVGQFLSTAMRRNPKHEETCAQRACWVPAGAEAERARREEKEHVQMAADENRWEHLSHAFDARSSRSTELQTKPSGTGRKIDGSSISDVRGIHV